MANPEHLAKLKEGVQAWNEWRGQNPEILPDLEGTDLASIHMRKANLSKANLGLAHLNQTDLSWSHLNQANLSGAHLRGANLIGAYLVGANLSLADLTEANLSGADLFMALLFMTNLSGAVFSLAAAGMTDWGSLDLSGVMGLDRAKHLGPSTVGTDTLRTSKGRIPEVFLRGCGLADWEIENAKLYNPDLSSGEFSGIQHEVHRLHTRGPIQTSPVFISYSHDDAEFVDTLGRKLDDLGVRYWRDVKEATAGRLDRVIEAGMSLNPTVLLVLSDHSVASDWVQFEVDGAVQLSKKLGRDVLCPVALDDAWLKSTRLLRSQIRKSLVLDFSQWRNEKTFAVQFRKLIDGLGIHCRTETVNLNSPQALHRPPRPTRPEK